MDAMQPWLLASGAAIGSGMVAAAVARVLHARALRRRVAGVLGAWAAGQALDDPRNPLSPLDADARRRLAVAHARLDEAEAQRRRMSADMVALMQQTDAAIRAKDRLLAAANHDLRQPLQAMDLAVDQLGREIAPARAQALAQLRTGMRTIVDVLDGLLLVSQLEAGTLAVHAAPCDLRALFGDLAAAHAPVADAAGVRFACRPGTHAVFTDAGMLGSLLARLLENALKATPPGGTVLLAARAHRGSVRIQVRDNGVGIAPVHQPRVFDEFFQVGNPERDHRKGFGLGLAVASRMASLLGTRVEVRSRLHGGSCFWLDLPRAAVAQRPPRALVLVAEQHQREALAATLAGWGYVVQAESDPVVAARAPGPFDAVLCALDRADDPGWALFGRAGRMHDAARIVLCAAPHPELLDAALRHHARALTRPPPPAKLRALLAPRAPPARGTA